MQISISNIVKGTVIGSAFTAISRYFTRVTQDSAIYEKPLCVESGINSSPLLQQASMLILPSGYKGGKLYAEIPTNGNGDLTWTRGSDAFRTNASGVIQRVPWNLLQYSEQFDNAVWGKQRSTISANVTSSPNGTLTADKLVETNVNGTHIIFTNISQPSTPRKNQTYSFYAKQGERNWIATSGDMGTTYFNLANGQVGAVTTSTFWFSGITASMENVGNDWYRCVLSGFGFIEFNLGIKLATADGTDTYTGDGTSGAFIWGAQLVEGTTAQTYLPTTDRLNFPRLSYMYGSCPSALLEPQRTNLITQSQNFTDISWSKLGLGAGSAPVVTSNAGISPEGINNATRVQFNCGGTTSSDRSILQKASVSITNTTNYAATIYVKAYSSGEVGKQLRFISESAVNQITITLTDSWQRVSTTGVSNAILSNYLIETRGTFTTNTTADILIYGAQLEAGAYPTTYIPTTGSATATRVADSFSRSNIYTNGLISASGGTWFVELRGNVSYTRDAGSEGLFIGDTSVGTTNCLQISSPIGGGRLRILKRVAGTGTELYSTLTDTIKVAIKWNGTSADVFVNGTKRVSATAYTTTTMEFLGGLSADVPKFIQAMALYPEPLTDAKLIELTTL